MHSTSLRGRIACFSTVGVALIVLGGGTPASAASGIPWPHSGQAVLMVDGRVLGTSGPVSRPQPIASVAKIMDAYQVLLDHPMGANDSGPTFTVLGYEAAAYRAERFSGQSLVPVSGGERISERQALEAMLLPSANDVARILARWDAGSIPAFLRRENATAARLGMSHTRYTDPAGVDSRTVSTAPDVLRLTQAAMALPAFARIVGESRATIPVAGTVHTINPILGRGGVTGVKPGWTSAAGSCLVFSAHVRGKSGSDRSVYGVVLGQRGGSYTAAAAVATRLIDSVRNAR